MGVTGRTGVKTIAVDQDESERRYKCLKKSQELGQTVVAIAGAYLPYECNQIY